MMSRLKSYTITLILLCISLVVASNLAESCGKRKVVNFLVVNGTEAKDGHWPWHVAIFRRTDRSFEYACGGTILDQNTVLTVAHCLMTANGIIAKRLLTVQVGRNQLSVASKRVQEHAAVELIIHPEFNVNGTQHDIALIMLATDITYTDYIQPVCLWNRADDLNAIVGSWGTVIGFGIDETDDVSDSLREATIPVVSHMACIESNREFFGLQLTSNMFCAGNRDGISACNGDSGGGFFFNYNNVWFVRGVVSFTKPRQYANNCDTKAYTVFTDVAKYLKWIEQHMPGTTGQPITTWNDSQQKIRLLPMSTCGSNPYGSREESSKPVILGYPWMGLVECYDVKTLKTETLCQATLISDRYLVSAANCIRILFPCNRLTVRLGEYDRSTIMDCAEVDGKIVCSPSVQILRIESTIIHEGFNKPHLSNDIGLIRLQDRADTNQSNVKPICLPVTSELRSQKPTHYTMTTWNRMVYVGHSFAETDQTLERAPRELFDWTKCYELWKKHANITSRHICMKSAEVPSCVLPFLSSPLQLVQQVLGKKRYVMYGLSLYRGVCSNALPDLYTNVASYVDWILENMQE